MTETRYLVVTDFETTGLNSKVHEIIQLSRLTVDLSTLSIVLGSELTTYVKPMDWGSRSQKAMEVNQITIERLEWDGVSLKQAMELYCRDVDWSCSVVAAWGNDFEMKFLDAACRQVGRVAPFSYKSFDVRTASFVPMIMQRELDYRSLADAARWYNILVDDDRLHDARYDVYLTCEILLAALDRVSII